MTASALRVASLLAAACAAHAQGPEETLPLEGIWQITGDSDGVIEGEPPMTAWGRERFELSKGIPFPTFVEATREFGELRVEVEWDRDGARGGAAIENGRLVDKWTGEREAQP